MPSFREQREPDRLKLRSRWPIGLADDRTIGWCTVWLTVSAVRNASRAKVAVHSAYIRILVHTYNERVTAFGAGKREVYNAVGRSPYR
jgi:hypothetical protein